MDDDDGYFDERVAARYDESEAEIFDSAVVDPVIDFRVELAESGRALELGIGTGRIALPLAQRGVPAGGSGSRSRATAASTSRSGKSRQASGVLLLIRRVTDEG